MTDTDGTYCSSTHAYPTIFSTTPTRPSLAAMCSGDSILEFSVWPRLGSASSSLRAMSLLRCFTASCNGVFPSLLVVVSGPCKWALSDKNIQRKNLVNSGYIVNSVTYLRLLLSDVPLFFGRKSPTTVDRSSDSLFYFYLGFHTPSISQLATKCAFFKVF